MSYSFNTYPGKPASVPMSTKYNLSGYTFQVQFDVTSDFSSPSVVGTATYSNGIVLMSLSAAQVDSVKTSNYRIKATKTSDSSFFYLTSGKTFYVSATPSNLTSDLIGSDGYIKDQYIPPGSGGGTAIADNSIGAVKLNFDPATQSELDTVAAIASGKYAKPGTGIPETDLASAVQTKLNTGGSGTVSDATTTSKGIVQLAGDLAGSSTAPTVPGLALKAPLASPTFTGTVSGVSKSMVGLANVDNTTDAAKPVSTAAQTAINVKYTKPGTGIPETDLASAVQTKLNSGGATVSDATTTTKGIIQLGGDLAGTATAPTVPDLASKYVKPVGGIPETDLTSAVQTKINSGGATVSDATTTIKGIVTLAGDLAGTATAPTVPGLASKAPLASPAFTGTPTGITKTHVGLSNVDNTADSAKPVSATQQTALNLKANLASPTFTGTVGGVTSAMVGLGNVNNTADISKPVSTAQQTAIDVKYTKPAPGIPEADLATAVQTKLNASSGGSTGTAYVRVALWDGTNYLVNGVAVTSGNRVASTYYKFLGGPDPSTLSLGVINGDEWKAA